MSAGRRAVAVPSSLRGPTTAGRREADQDQSACYCAGGQRLGQRLPVSPPSSEAARCVIARVVK